MIFPRGLMDMQTWMEKRPEHTLQQSDESLRTHILHETMQNLTSAVAYIHREIEGDVGYHRDIKPANILLFEKPNWTWKICDFGCSNLKPADDTSTSYMVATAYYAPPEFYDESWKATEERELHGRSHDVYSLGCVFLELVTILAYGWSPDGRAKFEGHRADAKFAHLDVDDQERRKATAFRKHPDVIHSWCQGLKERTSRPKLPGKVVDIIEEMVSPVDERLTVWEADVYLFSALGAETEQVIERLEDVVQGAKTVPNSESNPRTRASSKAMGKMFLDILDKNGWCDYSPTSTANLKRQVRKIGNWHSTLPSSFMREPFVGRNDLYNQISGCFRKTDSVALYGLGGIGYAQ